MCGRFVQHADPEIYAGRYVAELDPDALGDWRPSFNVAPTRLVLAIRARQDVAGRELTALRWGLIPSWSDGPDRRYSMINARAETVATKPAYRSAFKRRRCLIPAEGFYEWRPAPADAAKAAKQPFFIRRRDQASMLLAGLWELWHPAEGDPVQSCTIVVTQANSAIAPVHERMPAIIEPADIDAWLDPANDGPALTDLLRPAAASGWLLEPVSRRVNSPRNDDAGLIAPEPDGLNEDR
jgi:putative SOS response-associated peptidase YedK